MPGVELTPQQAELIFGYIFDNPPLRDEDHMAKYRQIAAKLRYVIANSPNFGLTVDTRAVLCEACAAAFTQEHYRHFMDFFGYRVNFPEK